MQKLKQKEWESGSLAEMDVLLGKGKILKDLIFYFLLLNDYTMLKDNFLMISFEDLLLIKSMFDNFLSRSEINGSKIDKAGL